VTSADLIRSEIEHHGPILFERFMELALYAPGAGYYVRARDPFGVRGDFFTAEQLQPVFGIVVAQFIETIRERMNVSAGFHVVQLGAGRAEMSEAFGSRFLYTPVDVDRGQMPERITGVVFANEFFDALPVHLAARRAGVFRNVRIALQGDAFVPVDAEASNGDVLAYLERHYGEAEDDSLIEVHLRGLDWMDRIAAALDGALIIIDYGYTAREWIRHTAGTLMSYRKHTASPDVFDDPGNRDITAHVPFSVLEERAVERGFRVERFNTLARFLLDAGEKDQFAAALAADDEKEAVRRRMQLKTLLYSLGETFRVLVLEKPKAGTQ
jgi:SAM-dependent MidA family methyltransferase